MRFLTERVGFWGGYYSYLLFRTVQAGLTAGLFNSSLVEGRPSLQLSDLNIVAAIFGCQRATDHVTYCWSFTVSFNVGTSGATCRLEPGTAQTPMNSSG